ncbi:hypothetical protein FHG87_000247 [Trinorchestia longiramus]|nr:hypothetical protein FHG87_000247 [Trinorchestia longiramus]
MGYRTFSRFTIETPTRFSTITWLQLNPNLDSKEHSIFPKQRCMTSKDLNLLEFFIWFVLETRVLATPHTSFESFKAKLQMEWEAIPREHIRTACNAFVNRLKALVRTKGCSTQ